MKKLGVILLLVSLGLNLGLGWRLMSTPDRSAGAAGRQVRGAGRVGSHWERPAAGDSTAWRRFMGRRLDHLISQLGLRPDQIPRFRAAQEASLRAMRSQRRAVTEARSRLRELMVAKDIDRGAVREAMAELGHRQAVMDSLAAETVLNELAVLDQAQRARYLEFLPAEAGRRHGRGRGGP